MRRLQVLVFAVLLALAAGCASGGVASSRGGATGSAIGTSATTSPSAAGGAFACTTTDPYRTTAGTAVRQSVTLGDTQATLTGTSVNDYGSPNGLQDGVLRVAESGRVVAGLPISPPAPSTTAPSTTAPSTTVQLASIGAEGGGSLCLAQFRAGSAPVALVALTTGGAHCCIVLRAIQSASAGHTPATFDRDLGNYGVTLQRAPGGPLLVTADNAFAYSFSSYAGSFPPIQIFTVDASGFVDVTRAHADLVRPDLDRHWKAYTGPTASERLGALAGWVADKCLLDPAKQAPDAWSFVDQQNAAGKLSAPDGWPHGSAYIAALRALLVHHGYCVAATASATRASSGSS